MPDAVRPIEAFEQLCYLIADVRRITNGRWWRWFLVPFTLSFATIATYRFDRACFLLMGSVWPGVRALFSPLAALLRPWLGRSEIHYRADIGPGLLILHPSLGVVVSGVAKLGPRVILTGGNCIGSRGSGAGELILIGAGTDLGANACVIGPLSIGADARIGAGAVVVNDIPARAVAVGVPARVIAAINGGRVSA